MIRASRPWSNFAVFFCGFLERPSNMVFLQYNTCYEKQQQKHIRFKKCKPSKRCSFVNLSTFFWHRSYLSVTEKSNTYDLSFPQASISKNNSVSLNQLKGSKPKMCIKSDFEEIILKLATYGQREKAFLLSSKFCPQWIVCPCPGLYTYGETRKKCI